jgi:TPR repeat protein
MPWLIRRASPAIRSNKMVMSGFVNHDDNPELERPYAALDAGNYPEAFRLYLPLPDAGVAYAQSTLAPMLRYGLGVEQDVAQGLMRYLRAADQGLPLTLHNPGTLYSVGAWPSWRPSFSAAIFSQG